MSQVLLPRITLMITGSAVDALLGIFITNILPRRQRLFRVTFLMKMLREELEYQGRPALVSIAPEISTMDAMLPQIPAPGTVFRIRGRRFKVIEPEIDMTFDNGVLVVDHSTEHTIHLEEVQ